MLFKAGVQIDGGHSDRLSKSSTTGELRGDGRGEGASGAVDIRQLKAWTGKIEQLTLYPSVVSYHDTIGKVPAFDEKSDSVTFEKLPGSIRKIALTAN